MRGDVNADGAINIIDVTLLINALLNTGNSTINQANADCDQDGLLTIGDVTKLIHYLLNNNW